MKTVINQIKKCWCGNEDLEYFAEKYSKCNHCNTLLSSEMPNSTVSKVTNDDTDFYGRNYWLSHQEKDCGFPNITERSRNDLHERCVYWLKTVLQYKLPPGRTVELGCSHGGFVAMLKWTGFDALGIELSPWVAEYARSTFDVQVLVGPIEDQKIEKESLSLIILMDVLEHLIDPVSTVQHCLGLLKNNGMLVVQTPRLDEEVNYQEMISNNNPFLKMLKEKEHLFLFSKESITKMLRKIGFEYIHFEEAIFKHYDMFLFASRTPIGIYSKEEQGVVLNSSPKARFIQALLDLENDKARIHGKLLEAEHDRSKRLNVIKKQGRKLGLIEAERNILLAQLTDLRRQYETMESDRAARLEVIHKQGQQIGQQGQQIGQIESERNNLKAQLNEAISLLDSVTNSTFYKIIRKIGYWEWFETTSSNLITK